MSDPVKPSNVNLPNVLTGIRIVLIPVFVFAAYAGGGAGVMFSRDDVASGARSKPSHGGDAGSITWMWVTVVLFIAMMITDKLDGDIARAREIVTDFGKIADPIADKALMISALVCLNLWCGLPWWITVVIIARELGITLWRMVQLRRGVVVPASKGGKIKTTLQAAAVAAFFLPLGPLVHNIAVGLMLAAVVVTVVTGVMYLVDSFRVCPVAKA